MVGGSKVPLRSRSVAKEKAVEISLNGLYLCRQRPTLPHTFACSNIGPAGLNFRVRDGNGWIPRGKITDNLIAPGARKLLASGYKVFVGAQSSDHAISGSKF